MIHLMKKNSSPLAALILLIGIFHAHAGAIFYQAIPAAQSDASSGISSDNYYTSAVDGGNAKGTERVINGVTLHAMAANGQSSAADHCILNALSGSFSNAGGASTTIKADGTCKEVLSDMTFNNGASDNSQQEIVLDPASLEAGRTYDLRVYICNSAGQNRQVNLSFVGDGQAAVETGFFNEDDARSSAGGFPDPNQAYYINYRFTWDGDSIPGVTITQKTGTGPFVLYTLTNQVVPTRLTSRKVNEATNQVGVQRSTGALTGRAYRSGVSGGTYRGQSLRSPRSSQGGTGPTTYWGAGSEAAGSVKGGGAGQPPSKHKDKEQGGKPTGAWVDKDGNFHSGSQGTQTTRTGKKTKPSPTPGKKPSPKPGPLETPRDPRA